MGPHFLRIFLVQRTGIELMQLVDALDTVLAQGSNRTTPVPPLALAPDTVTRDTTQYLIRFDGSFIAGKGAGIGVTIGYRNEDKLIATFSIPTKTKDA